MLQRGTYCFNLLLLLMLLLLPPLQYINPDPLPSPPQVTVSCIRASAT